MANRKKQVVAEKVDREGGVIGVARTRSKTTSTLLMLGMTAILLTLLFPPFYCFFLAPVALAPFCICVLRRPMRWGYLGLYYLLGVVFFAANLYWMWPVTVLGTLALALFVGLYFPLFALGLHRLVVHLRVPAMVAVPLVWTAVEFIRATFVLGGFPWFLVGNCLTPAPMLIQAADLFGVWGLSFLIGMMNGYVVDVLRLPLRHEGRLSVAIRRLTALMTVMVMAEVGYGYYRLNEQTTRPGPRVAVIQENIPQSLKALGSATNDIFLRYLRLSEEAAAADPKPDLVVWPETMVPLPINQELLVRPPDEFRTLEELRTKLSEAYARGDGLQRVSDMYRALGDEASRYGVSILAGYGSMVETDDPNKQILQNRTVLLSPEEGGVKREAEYSKIHIVPFGELIPFRSVPVLKDLMMLMSPNGWDYSLTPGMEWTRFRLVVQHEMAEFSGGAPAAGSAPASAPAGAATRAAPRGGLGPVTITSEMRIYTFGTPICFEDTMPEPSRMMTAAGVDKDHPVKASFLINVSNDGWFQRVELDQHLQACQLRAVENRVAIARSVNTGNSGFIDSNGRVVKLVTDAQGQSIGAVGTSAMEMPIDARDTLYGRVGDLLPMVCGVVGTVLVGWTLVRPRHGKGRESEAA